MPGSEKGAVGTHGSSSNERIYSPAVDGLRFVAFFLVLLHHVYPIEKLASEPAPLVTAIARVQAFGWIGVDVFLVLSSFLLFSLLLEERRRTGTVSVGAFYVRRALRIWPLYFPYLLIAMLAIPFIVHRHETLDVTVRQHLLTFLTFTGNFSYAYFTPSLTQFFAHLWTISLEEQFYFIVPLLVFFGAGMGRKRALLLAGTGLAVTAVFRWYVLHNAIPYPMVWVNPACRLDPFIAGAIAALLLRIKRSWFDQSFGWAWLLGAAAIYLAVLAFPGIGESKHTIWQMTGVAACSFCLIMGTLSRRGLGALFSWAPLRYLGKISFGLYVYHEIGLYLTRKAIGPGWGGWTTQLLGAFAITVAISAVSYELWEKRFLKLKERFEVVRARKA